MEHELENVPSRRVTSLAKKLRSKKYRDNYLSSHIRMFLANQLASLQGEMSQQEFGQLLGKPQPVVSRLQNPDYGKYSLQTLLDIASKLAGHVLDLARPYQGRFDRSTTSRQAF